MPERSFLIPLLSTERIRVWMHTEQGGVVNFTVQYETFFGGRWMPVVRYDGWHDQPHRDTLDENGHVVHKDWYTLTYAAALTYGLNDLKVNWERYRTDFLRRVG
ncbi:MAG: hypothetical protein M3176_05175 [Chloroflexota bacterium]|nr:hypothetical protein [Chloroflexota bacterium]MDQ6906203.1 hypothetical protein [Chloroflexota bacterium]